jgi:Putative peptidoglycan binding domain
MCVRVGILTILLVCTVATATQSQPKIDKKRNERLEYETELQRLKRDRPKEYENTRQMATLWTQLLLGRLGYGIGPYNGVLDEKTESALREYQKQRKLPITGDPLSFETFEQTGKDTNLLEYEPTNLPHLFVFLDFWQDGFVSAKGTWTLTNEKMAWPEQTTHIECHRDKQICVEATALLTGEGGKKTVSVDIDNYAIERWDEHEIVTKPKETGFGCVRYLRRFNRVQKSVTGLRSTIKTGEQCKGVEAKEMHITLTDGFQVYWELHQNSKKAFRELMRFSPEALKSVEQEPGK